MRIGFYAPLKPPSHPTPSGDRAIARLFTKALQRIGHEVELISALRSHDREGCGQTQRRIHTQAMQEIERLKQLYRHQPPPELIFTYHVYHKAPDWIGVALADHLRIPYLIAEASFAPKQAHGPWHTGHRQALRCIQAAKSIISLNPADDACIEPLLCASQSLERIKPFLGDLSFCTLDRETSRKNLARRYQLDDRACWLITVAMMRAGDKQASYRQLAEALTQLAHANWQLLIVGDGSAAETIKAYFSAIMPRCRFTGVLPQTAIFDSLCAADVYVWPAINEALGLALLEAQACGLPVVAQNVGGVASVIKNKITGIVTPPDQPDEFKLAVNTLLNNDALRVKLARNAKENFNQHHAFHVACENLATILQRAFN